MFQPIILLFLACNAMAINASSALRSGDNVQDAQTEGNAVIESTSQEIGLLADFKLEAVDTFPADVGGYEVKLLSAVPFERTESTYEELEKKGYVVDAVETIDTRTWGVSSEAETLESADVHLAATTYYGGVWGSNGWNLNYLNGYVVSCGSGGLLSGFQLRSFYNPDRFQYQYYCTGKPTSQNFFFYTPTNTYGNQNVVYLDRHYVDCGPGRLMNGWNLESVGGSFRVKIHCTARPTSLCYAYQTPSNDLRSRNGGNINYLDRHNVVCPNGFYLNSWRFQNNGNFGWFNYLCCQN